MSIIINQTVQVEPKPTFYPKTLVISEEGGRVYLVTGPGQSSRHFAGVRLNGGDSSAAFEYGETFLRSSVRHFDGEVVIKND